MNTSTVAVKKSARHPRRRRTRPQVVKFVPTARQKELLVNPHVQAAALARAAVMATFDGTEPDVDDYTDKFSDSDEVCLKAMGMSLGSLYAEEVVEVIEELSYRMETSLKQTGLLLSNCGEKWQEQRVA